MGTEILLLIFLAAIYGTYSMVNNYIKRENAYKLEKLKIDNEERRKQERRDRERKEIAFFKKHPETYKMVKNLQSDGKTISLAIEDEYRSIFIEYIHRFKDFARIKGYNAQIAIEAKEESKNITCNFDIKPIQRSEDRTSPEELFRNYLFSYPIFF